MKDSKVVEVEVAFISLDANIGTPVLFLKEKVGNPKHMLPIWIGQGEALAIQFKLKGESPPRPMTHDLLKNIVDNLDATVDAVYVHTMKNETFFGQVNLKADGKVVEIDARPSDAIALALRFEVPIFVAEQIIQETGILETDLKDAEKQQSKDKLENLDEDTLGRYTV